MARCEELAKSAGGRGNHRRGWDVGVGVRAGVSDAIGASAVAAEPFAQAHQQGEAGETIAAAALQISDGAGRHLGMGSAVAGAETAAGGQPALLEAQMLLQTPEEDTKPDITGVGPGAG